MKTVTLRAWVGDDMITVSHTKQGRVRVYTTGQEGETTSMSLAEFEARERRVAAIRALITRAVREGCES